MGAASTQTGGMGMVIFDTLAAARDLEAAGIEPKHAEAIVSIQRKTAGELATKTDLDNAVSKLATKADLDNFATKIALDNAVSKLATKAELDAAVSKLATKADLENLATKTELVIANLATKVELAELRAELKADMLKVAVGIVIANAALTAALVRLL